MGPTHLLLNNKTYSFDQIRSKKYEVSSHFEAITLTFCSQWLNGKSSFKQKTSGSTGKPKVIHITRQQMKLSASQTIKALNLLPNDVALICVNPAYIAGKMMLVRAFEHRLKIVIVEPEANPLEKLVTPFHFAAMVPMQIAHVLQNETTRKKLLQSKAVLIGGSPLSRTLAHKIATLNCPIFETFGMTETVSHIALKRINSAPEDFFTIVGDLKIQTNANGQLIIKGAITGGKKLITNDVVHLLSSRTFRWIGRIDNVINSGGIKIQLEEVEKAIELLLMRFGINKRFFLSKKKDDYLGDKLVLYIESNSKKLATTLDPILRENLNKFNRPKEIIYLRNFVETASGKIDKTLSPTQNSQ